MATLFKASLTPSVPGITNQSLVPKSIQTPISMGQKAVTPVTAMPKPPTTLASSQKVPSSPGAYKGVPITAGTDAQIQAQMAEIDRKSTPTPTYPGLVGQQILAKQQNIQPTTPTYPGLVTSLANQQNSPYNQSAQTSINGLQATAQTNPGTSGQAYTDYQNKVNELQKLKTSYGIAQGNISSEAIPLEFQQGRSQVLANQYANQLDAAQQAVNQAQQGIGYQIAGNQAQQAGYNQAGNLALSGQGQNQSALNAAAGYAQPQLGAIGSQQYYNPLGSNSANISTNSALASLPPQAQDAIRSYAQQVQNGQMTRADAESRLSAYGITGTNALNEALGSGFNTNASNASAGTTATGQQVQTAAQSTNAALDTLANAFNSLPGWQTGGIPATNNLAQWIGKQFGSQALQEYKTNLADARSQLIGVLNSSGGTPTGNESTANEYLPDNMTKAQFDANVGTPQNPGIVRQLISQKVGAFTQSGQQATNPMQSSGSTTSAGGFQFIQDVNGNWIAIR